MSLFSAFALERCHNQNCRFRTARTRRLSPTRGIVLNGEWFCCPSCFQAGVQAKSMELMGDVVAPPPPRAHRIPLGLLLLSRNQISQETLRAALEHHAASAGRIGDVLRAMGAVTEQQITTAVAAQWSCPVFPLRDHPGAAQYAHLLPLGLLERYRAVPVHFSEATRILHVAFSQDVSSSLLYASQQMLSCTAQACMADESAILNILERTRQNPDRSEFLLARTASCAEMARVATGYAQQLNATDARLLTCEDYFWLRLTRKHQMSDFLFHFAFAASAHQPLSELLASAT